MHFILTTDYDKSALHNTLSKNAIQLKEWVDEYEGDPNDEEVSLMRKEMTDELSRYEMGLVSHLG